MPVDAALPGADQRLRSLQPDIVIFDLSETQPDMMIRLWKAQTHLSLIGVDLAEGQALVAGDLSQVPPESVEPLGLEDLYVELLGDHAKRARR